MCQMRQVNKNLLILGAGGHGHVVKEIAAEMRIFEKIDFLDDNPDCEESIGLCCDNDKFAGDYSYAFSAFGDSKIRMKWIKDLEDNSFTIPVLIHPTAFVSPSASVYPGTVVEAKAIINTNSVIETGCIISVGTIVDHDAFVGYGSHIDCGAIIKSNCTVKACTKVESGKIITHQGLSIHKGFSEGNDIIFKVGV